MDIEKYKSEINKNLPKLKDLLNSKTQSLTQSVRDTMDILNSREMFKPKKIWKE